MLISLLWAPEQFFWRFFYLQVPLTFVSSAGSWWAALGPHFLQAHPLRWSPGLSRHPPGRRSSPGDPVWLPSAEVTSAPCDLRRPGFSNVEMQAIYTLATSPPRQVSSTRPCVPPIPGTERSSQSGSLEASHTSNLLSNGSGEKFLYYNGNFSVHLKLFQNLKKIMYIYYMHKYICYKHNEAIYHIQCL